MEFFKLGFQCEIVHELACPGPTALFPLLVVPTRESYDTNLWRITGTCDWQGKARDPKERDHGYQSANPSGVVHYDCPYILKSSVEPLNVVLENHILPVNTG
jgi:hypothetical protein